MQSITETLDVPDEDRFTASALRVLERAGALAVERGHAIVGPAHLLIALLDDESWAAEMLVRRGIDLAEAEELLVGLPEATAADGDLEPVQPPRGPETQMAVLHGLRLAQRDREGSRQAGSVHLLYGLAAGDSHVAVRLETAGLDESVLQEAVLGPQDATAEPLPIDFSLQLDERPEPTRLVERPAEPPRAGGPVDGDLAVYRVIDASANRAREGLRVVEDFTRFVLDDAHLVTLLKELRHELAAALAPFDDHRLLRARDTTADVGTGVSTDSESRRADVADVVRASLKRGEEALRSLEEFGKVLDPAAGRRFETLRYRLYTVEKAVLGTLAGRASLAGRHLYLLLTRDLCRHDPEHVLREAIAGGVSVVQVREKSASDRELLDWLGRVREITHASDTLLVVNDRPDLAVLCDADGVHVGQDEATVRDARRVVGPNRLVGVSTHDLEQARAAVLEGADYVGVGPTFPSRTKSFDEFAGIEFVRAVSTEVTLPTYVLGGVNETNVSEVVEAGGTRVAVTAAISSADDPRAAAAALRSWLPR